MDQRWAWTCRDTLFARSSKDGEIKFVAVSGDERSIPLTDKWSKPFYTPGANLGHYVKGNNRQFKGMSLLQNYKSGHHHTHGQGRDTMEPENQQAMKVTQMDERDDRPEEDEAIFVIYLVRI